MKVRLAAGWSLAVVLVTGCAAGRGYDPSTVALPGAFAAVADRPGSQGSAPEAGEASARWWQRYGDPLLDELVDRALRDNPDPQIALARLNAARSRTAGVASQLLPTVGVAAGGGRGTGSDLTRMDGVPALSAADNKGSLSQIGQVAGLSASWELDVFGTTRHALAAARAEASAVAASRDAVVTEVVASVVRQYLLLRALQSRRLLAEQGVQAAEQAYDLQRARFEHGLSNELDLRLAERERASRRAIALQLGGETDAARYHLATLLGGYPQDLPAAIAEAAPLPVVPEAIAPGLPTQLLRRRPDIRYAEQQLAAANQALGLQLAALFPHLQLNGASGIQGATVGAGGGHIWAFGLGVYWPLLDFGSLDAQIQVARFGAQAALLRYRQSIIGAVEDVNSAVTAYSVAQQSLVELRVADAGARRSLELAQQRYQRGLTDYLNVVDALREQLSLADRLIEAQLASAQAYVALNLAVGLGWQEEPPPPLPARPKPALWATVRELVGGNTR